MEVSKLNGITSKKLVCAKFSNFVKVNKTTNIQTMTKK